MHSFCLFLHYSFFYKYMFLNDMLHLYTLVRPKCARGFCTPQYGVRSLNTLTSAAPWTYSIICIGSESCLGSIVGFARLLCFGALRSAISAKVALGELLRLCTSWESRKVTVMIQRETGQSLDDLSESIGFLRFNEGPLPGQAHTPPEFGRA